MFFQIKIAAVIPNPNLYRLGKDCKTKTKLGINPWVVYEPEVGMIGEVPQLLVLLVLDFLAAADG
jgi:hypothetical protein